MEKRNFCLIFGIVTVLAVALIGVLAGCTPQEEKGYGATDSLSQWVVQMEDPDPVVELKDVHIPSDMREEGLGLFWMTVGENGSENYLKSTTQEGKDAFNPEKPIMIFFHGMQIITGATEDEGYHFANYWIDAGYNVGIFNWSQLADGIPMAIEGKIWGAETGTNGKGQNVMDWTSADGDTSDKPNVSVAEIFVAYYMDFMKNVDYTGSEIRFTGLSLGGQMALATSSYLVTKEIQGLLDTKYIPDRVALFDPYIMQQTLLASNTYIPWLKRNMFLPTGDEDFPETTGAELMGDIVVMLHNRGIAMEYIPSVSGVVPKCLYAVNDGARNQFYQNCTTLDLRTDYATDPLSEFNGFHLAGREWYAKTLGIDYVLDTKMENSKEYAVGARTPTPYTYLRSGVTYQMNENWNVDPDEDVIFSTNITNAQVGGFAYVDENDDGIYNDRIQNRLAGVKVELYLVNGTKTEMIASAITDHTGAYLLNVENINANGFSKFFIKVYAPKGYQIGKTASTAGLEDVTLVNAVNTDGRSEEFTLAHTKVLKVLNLGFKK